MGTTTVDGPPLPVEGPPAPTVLTPAQFAVSVLYGLGITPTFNNTTAMQVWMSAESGNQNDPLNVRNLQQGGNFTFPTQQAGIAATVATINQPNMAPIKAALSASVTPATFAKAAAATPWDAGHYAGSDFLAGLDGPRTGWGASALGHQLTNQPGDIAQITNGATGAVKAATSWTSSLGTLLQDLTTRAWWVRVGEFALGAVLFLVGLIGFLSTTQPGQRIVSEGTAVAAVA